MTKIFAVIPVKETTDAKQRLSGLLNPRTRQALALAMFEDVLDSLSQVNELDGIIVVTTDRVATNLAQSYGAAVSGESASSGHTDAITGTARRLGADGSAILALPGDIPLIAPQEVRNLISAAEPGRTFVIAPAHDELGSNAILCHPAHEFPFRYGDNSYFPHLNAARKCGFDPVIVDCPGNSMDIDHPEDLLKFLKSSRPTRARKILIENGIESILRTVST